jgi:hypothetical protein
MDTDPLVRDYLGRLEAASWPLAPTRRAELAEEVREHIEAALGEAGGRDAATIRGVLDRLGPPEEIVAAEAGADRGTTTVIMAPAPPRATPASPWGAVELIALALLTLGAVFLPFVGPLVGLGFVWASGQWTRGEKGIATVIVVVLLALPIAFLLTARTGA